MNARAFIVASLLVVVGCNEGPSGWGLACFDVDEGECHAGASLAADRWPELTPIISRLDVFGENEADLGIDCVSAFTRVEGCALWPGSALARARILVDNSDRDEVAALVEHELQHLRPSVWALDDACADHRPECWQ